MLCGRHWTVGEALWAAGVAWVPGNLRVLYYPYSTWVAREALGGKQEQTQAVYVGLST